MADGDHARLQRGTPNNMIVYWWCCTFLRWIIVVGFLARKNIVVGQDRCRWLLRATNGVFEEMRRGHTDGNGRASISPACFYFLAFMTSAKSHENVTFIKCFGLFRAGHIWAAGVNLSLCCTKLLGHVVLNFLVSCWGPCPGIWLDISKFLLPPMNNTFPCWINVPPLLSICCQFMERFCHLPEICFGHPASGQIWLSEESTFMRHRNLNWKCSRQHICQNVLSQLIKI